VMLRVYVLVRIRRVVFFDDTTMRYYVCMLCIIRTYKIETYNAYIHTKTRTHVCTYTHLSQNHTHTHTAHHRQTDMVAQYL
jgi:hypothetical protein